MKSNYKVVVEPHEHNGKTYKDLVVYFDKERFVMVPLSQSRKAKSYFYDLLDKATK